jgi:hypothetical protein
MGAFGAEVAIACVFEVVASIVRLETPVTTWGG